MREREGVGEMRELYEVWVHQCKEFRKLLTDTNYDELRNTLCSKCIHEIECSHAIETPIKRENIN